MRAFENDPAGTTAYGTSVGYPRLRAWIADRHGVEPERVLVTNGSMQADAFLFDQLVRSAATRSSSSAPPTTARCSSLRERGARVHAVELEPDGIDTDALAACSPAAPARARSSPTSSPTSRTRPATRSRWPSARRCSRSPPQYGFLVFEDDPYVALRFSGEPLPTMLSMDPERVVYASSFSKTVCPGIRVGYLVGPPELIDAIAQLATNTYISPEHGLAGDRVRVLRLGRDRALDRDRQDGARRARRHARRRRCAASCPRPSSSRPRAATSCG